MAAKRRKSNCVLVGAGVHHGFNFEDAVYADQT
jgi:hypothetical protein